MDFLSQQNRLCEGDNSSELLLSARDKDVVIIGGGATGAKFAYLYKSYGVGVNDYNFR